MPAHKLLTSEDMMQSINLHVRKNIKIQNRFKQVGVKRIGGTGDAGIKEKSREDLWLLDIASKRYILQIHT